MLDILYDAADAGDAAVLTGVDNLVVHHHSHDLFVAEDGGNMELVLITHETRTVAPFLRYPVPHSELAGPAFSPDGSRLYIASQGKRHTVDEATGREIRGEIFEITGPFRQQGGDGLESFGGGGVLGAGALALLGGAALAGLLSEGADSP